MAQPLGACLKTTTLTLMAVMVEAERAAVLVDRRAAALAAVEPRIMFDARKGKDGKSPGGA